MRNSLSPIGIVPLALMLVIAVTGASAQTAEDDGAETPSVPTEENTQAKKENASFSDNNILDELEKIEVAIEKFHLMGVGVAPFEQAARDVRALQEKQENAEAQALLERLKQNLVDQQKRFYANKIQVWHNQRIAMRSPTKNGAKSVSHRSLSNGSALSKGAHGVLSKAKGGVTPLIYPIAR